MMRICAGWLQGVRQVPVKNFGSRPKGEALSLIVIHCISLPPNHFGGYYVDSLFCGCLNPEIHPYFAKISALEVSSHLFIDRLGRITQYVSFLDRAWHAGRSSYLGHKECNDYSIGIELEGCEYCAYTIEQYLSLDQVVETLRRTYPDIKDRIAGHEEVSPGRKTDPGPYFDWKRYRS